MENTTAAAEDLTAKSPAWIDAQLNRIGFDRAKLQARADHMRSSARHYRIGRLLEAQADEYDQKILELSEAMRPYYAEYDRRGGWTRAYLVQNNGGHVHSSTNCASCYLSTQYVWLTDYSGKTEEEIVYAAGQLACTVCYPSAPVDVLKRVGEIRRASDVEREKRAAEKAAKSQAAATAAVVDPGTGKTLYKTERAATNEISSTLWNLNWYGDNHPSGAQWKSTVAVAVAALAAKQGADPATLLAEYRAKADKKFAADARKTLRELKQHRGSIEVDDLVPGLRAWVQSNGIPEKV